MGDCDDDRQVKILTLRNRRLEKIELLLKPLLSLVFSLSIFLGCVSVKRIEPSLPRAGRRGRISKSKFKYDIDNDKATTNARG